MRSTVIPFALLALTGVLTGCSSSFEPGAATPATAAIGSVHGIVHGGRQPIAGAQIYALQASTTGYSSASTSLITTGTTQYPITTDASGGATNGFNYVTTDANGGFALGVETNTCTSGAIVYLYALAGNPGAGTNTSSGLLAVLGICGASTTGGTTGFISDIPAGGVNIDELTTVAAAYTLAPFATDALHIGAPSTGNSLATTAIQNAAINAGQLVNLSSGAANSTIPGGSGTIPVTTINTLGNILAACINSSGSGSTGCSTIFSTMAATDTATAAIHIAQNPSITSYVIPPAIGSPYQPSLNASPNDYTLGVVYTVGTNPLGVAIDVAGNAYITNNNNNGTQGSQAGGGSVSIISSNGVKIGNISGGGISQPVAVAIDKQGSIWLTDTGTAGGVIKLNSDGSPATGSYNYENGALVQPLGVAIDSIGNAWITDPGQQPAVVVELSSAGGVLGTFGGGSFAEPLSLQFDSTGNLWVADLVGGSTGKGSIVELSNTGATQNILSGGGILGPYTVAIDASGGVWVPDSGNTTTADNTVSKFNLSTGVVSNYSGGGITGSVADAIDGNGNVWLSNQGSASNSVSELTNGGAALSGSNGYTAGGTLNGPGGVAIDGSGNVWIANSDSNTVTELIGAAAPTITPTVAGLARGKTPGSKP